MEYTIIIIGVVVVVLLYEIHQTLKEISGRIHGLREGLNGDDLDDDEEE